MDFHFKQALRHAISEEQKRRKRREERMNFYPVDSDRPLLSRAYAHWYTRNGDGSELNGRRGRE